MGGSVTCVFLIPSASPPCLQKAACKAHQHVWRGGLSPGPSAWWIFPGGLKGTVLGSIQGEDFYVSTWYRAFTM